MNLITLQEAKNHLRIYDESQDDEINTLIASVSEEILTFIEYDVRQPQRDSATGMLQYDTDGKPLYTNDINPMIKGAALLYIELLFNQLDINMTGTLPTVVYLACRKLKDYTALSA